MTLIEPINPWVFRGIVTLLHRQDQLPPLLVSQDSDAHLAPGEFLLEEVIEHGAFAHALSEAVDGDDEVVFLKSGLFGSSVHAVLTHMGDEEGFASALDFIESALVVVVDPAVIVFHFGPVSTHGSLTIFDEFSPEER